MKLTQTTLALVAILGLAACETETEVVMEPVGDEAMMDDATMKDGDAMMETKK